MIGRKWARTSGGNPITTTYTYYDSTGELRTVDYSDSTPDVLYTYTRLGMLETATDGPLDGSGAIPAPRFTYTYVYDAANPFRQASEAVAGIHHQDKLLTRTYQTASDTAQNTVAGRYAGFTVGINGTPAQDYSVSYGFDDAGRLGTVNDGETFTYGYLANSSLVQTLTSPHHVATRTYEANRDVLASISNDLPAGKTYQHAGGVTNGPIQISAYGYVVNSLGQRTDLTRQGVAFAPSHYDHVGYNATGEPSRGIGGEMDGGAAAARRANERAERVSQLVATNRFSGTTPGQGAAQTTWDQGYVFDGLGNRTASTASVGAGNITYTPDSLNEYDWVSVPGVNNSFAPVYDDDGNLLQDGWTDQTWDGENRMISRSPRWQTGNDFRWAYDYDFRGRRVKMVGELWTGSVWQHYMTETFLYDGWNVACSYAKFGADSTWHKRSYTWGLDLSGSLQGAGGVGGLLALNGWYYPGSAGTAKWVYCYDGNGNVTQLLGTSGTHVILGAHYEYDAFGQITAAPNPWAYWTNIAWSNPFRFSTKFLSAWNRRNYEYNVALVLRVSRSRFGIGCARPLGYSHKARGKPDSWTFSANLEGLTDKFDFHPSDRPFFAEAAAWFGRMAQYAANLREFEIRFEDELEIQTNGTCSE